jgi:hypothetical protein
MARSAFGQCIYCGSTKDLTSEHVVPFGLGADFELPGASCGRCRDVTSLIERRVMEEQFTGPRLAIGYPSRHARAAGSNPSYPPIIGETADGAKMPVPFPEGLHPTLLWLPQYEMPGHLSGEKVKGINVNGVEVRQLSGMDIRQHAIANGFVSIEFTRNVKGYELARMLGKIALGFAADHFGVDYRVSPIGAVVRYKRDDAGQWIGQPTICPPPFVRKYVVRNGLHVVKLYGGKEIWAIVQLFAETNTTMDYLVIVVPDPQSRGTSVSSWARSRFKSWWPGTARVHVVTTSIAQADDS